MPPDVAYLYRHFSRDKFSMPFHWPSVAYATIRGELHADVTGCGAIFRAWRLYIDAISEALFADGAMMRRAGRIGLPVEHFVACRFDFNAPASHSIATLSFTVAHYRAESA